MLFWRCPKERGYQCKSFIWITPAKETKAPETNVKSAKVTSADNAWIEVGPENGASCDTCTHLNTNRRGTNGQWETVRCAGCGKVPSQAMREQARGSAG